MDAGRMNRRCTIQQPSATQDSLGQPASTWADVATVWADIRLNSGLEAIKADAQQTTTKASIRIRYRAGLTAGMRVVHNLVNYQVNAVLPDVGGREYVDLVCEVVV